MSYPLNISCLPYVLSMCVHEQGDQHVSLSIKEKGIWESFETELILASLQEGDTFIDVGANIGYYTVVTSAIVGASGKVIAFEPEPKNYQMLLANIALNNQLNVLPVHAGLSNVTQNAQIYLSDDNWGDHQIYDAGLARNSVSISLLHGDNFLVDKIDRIDVLKVDTQGAEFLVMTGLDAMIRKSLPKLTIIIEFWPFGLKKAGSHGHKLLDLLLSYQLPMAIVDQIEQRLIPCVESDIRPWINDLDNEPNNEGFLNLYLGPLTNRY